MFDCFWYCVEQYSSTAEVGILVIVAHTAKNFVVEKHPKDILHDKNYLWSYIKYNI